MTASLAARSAAEFIGTYVLTFTVACNVLGGTGVWAVTSIACSLMVMIYALGSVSGAHLNPAVTVALLITRKMDKILDGAAYMVAQIAGGIGAAFTAFYLFGTAFNLAPGVGYNGYQAVGVEIIFTTLLCFTVLSTAACAANEGNQYFGLAIGFCIVAGGYAGGPISGGAFNPAVSLGIDTASAGLGFGWSLAYTAAQIIGACMAALLFRVTRPEEFGGEAKTAVAKLSSELIGTYFLTVTAGLVIITGSPAGAWCIAAALMISIYNAASCSGGHLNPAVSASIALVGKQAPSETLQYAVAQLLGAVLAGGTYMGLTGKAFALAPAAKATWASAGAAEVIYTFVLCFTVLNVAAVQVPSKDMFGLAIGMCVVIGGFAAGSVSGGVLNPAVAFGVDTANAFKGGKWLNCLGYSAFQLVGSALAAGAFAVVRPSEKLLPK